MIISNAICSNCGGMTDTIFKNDSSCFLRKDIYNHWRKGCNFLNTPKSLKEVVDKLLIQSNIGEI